MRQPPRKFDWREIQDYWQIHGIRWSNIDFDLDPDGLTNVCFPGAPLWLNRYYARSQMMVYQKLYNRLPKDVTIKHALEVGCGAGRWCKFLAERGWDIVGIDLQPKLIEMNRMRYPHIQFNCVSVQDYVPEKPFGLISAVTVVQHMPFEEQFKVFKKFREVIELGGYIIMLDSIYYKTPHVFSHTVKEWRIEVEKAGFRCIAIQRYDYTPFLRIKSYTQNNLLRLIPKHRVFNNTIETPEALVATPPAYSVQVENRSFFGRLGNILLGDHISRSFLKCDSIVEPALIISNIALGARHCGFLFRAV